MQDIWTDILRISLAIVLSGLVGLERQLYGRWAGLRTLITVGLGTCTFTLIGLHVTENSPAELTRVIQGVTAGIGFLGAGTILKMTDQVEVKGLTTASSIWLTAAVGMACGLGLFVLAVIATLASLVVLIVLKPLERLFPPNT